MLRALILAIGLGLIVVPVSELMFWPVVATSIPGLVLFYALSALLAALLVERFGTPGWAGYVLAGGIFGWLIEGVVVNQTYEAVPFSLSWTPLAWHMTLSVMGAVAGLGWALRLGWVASTMICAAIGAFAGLWGGFGWTELAEDVATHETGLPFQTQIVLATAMMAAGHALLCRLPEARAPGWLVWILLGLAGVVWALVWALPLFPVSLAVPFLIGLSTFALWRGGRGKMVAPLIGRAPLTNFGAFLVIPAVAIPVQAAVIHQPWVVELNAFVAAPLTLIGTGAWLVALGACLLRRKSD